MYWQRVITCLGIVLWLTGAAAARADIYIYADAAGALHFSNAPTTGDYRFYMKEARPPLRDGVSELAWAQRLEPIIEGAAQRHHVDPALVKAVIRAESGFAPRARSPKGARGLMQLMPSTARQHRVERVYDPAENVDGGVRHLRLLLDRYRGDVRLALAAYNAGENAVAAHGGIPPYRETREYVERVLRFRAQYARQGS